MNIETFDFETLNKDGILIPYSLSYTYDSNTHYHVFEDNDPITISKYILYNFKVGCIYYAHNLLFDFLLFFKGLLSLNIKFNWLFINYNLYEVIIFFEDRKLIMRCSYKLIPYNLSDFYPSLSVSKKLYFPYNSLCNWDPKMLCVAYENILPQFKHLNLGQYLRIYSSNDSKILKEGLLNFFNTLSDLKIPYDKKSLTCGSISLNYYIKKYNKINLNLERGIKNVIRSAFYGGRCEVFGNQLYSEKVLHFDFSGMYQQCMEESLPFGNYIYESANFNINVPGFYYIHIIYTDYLPILPLRLSKLFFKEGEISGWYWHEEILLVLEHCKVSYFKIIHGYISLDNDFILKDFIYDLNKFKEQGLLKKNLGKLLINSFYGRLGLEDEMSLMELRDNSGDDSHYGLFGDLFLIKKTIKRFTKSNVALASCITAKARIRLYTAFREVMGAGGRILYCDTDSIFAAFNKNQSVENVLLGKHVTFDTYKHDTVILDSVFISPKTYGLILSDGREVIKIKGVNIKEISFLELKEHFYKKIDVISLHSSNISTKDLNVSVFIQKKEIKLQSYDKRVWSNDLIYTKPIYNTLSGTHR